MKEIKKEYCSFKYMEFSDILYNDKKYKSPTTISNELLEKKQDDVKILGFYITHSSQWAGNLTPILIEYKDILYISTFQTIIRKNFKGSITCTKDNIYYYLYGKRPIHQSLLEIIKIPNKNNISSKDYISIKCKKCNYIYEITVNKFLSGKRCPKCTNQIPYNSKNLCDRVYEKRPIDISKIFIYYVPLNIKNKNDYLYLQCIKCNNQWNTTTIGSFTNSSINCIHCENTSKGELSIKQFLDEVGIEYIQQYKFSNCKNKKELPFDFYIPVLNMCIEYDGEQHYKEVKHWGGEKGLTYRLNNDSIKTQYCIDNNINLIRISYEQNLFELLSKLFKSTE